MSVSVFLFALTLLLPTLAMAASVVVSPATVTLPVSGSRTFVAAVSGLASSAVTWEVNGHPGGSLQEGLVTTAGVYTAPKALTVAPTVVTLTARSMADATVTGSSIVTVRNQVPWLTSVTPSALTAGSAFTIDVVGSRFVPGAQVFLGTTALTTTFLGDTQLQASGSLSASQLGGLNLHVENPGPVSSTDLALVIVPAASPGSINPDTLAAIRFLQQATFGPTDPDIAEVQQIGIDAWIAKQMNPALTPPSVMPDGLTVSQVPTEWIRQMAMAPDQLRLRVAFALSQLFVVSMNKNTNGEELSPYVRLLANNAFGNFRTLLQEVTLSPTMGKYLDMVNSKKPAINGMSGANENYPRELMQLFTIGTYKLDQDGFASLDAAGHTIATYDQDVVRNLANAFTGWVYPTLPGKVTGPNNPANFNGWMTSYDPSHDKSQKTIFDGIVVPYGMTASAELSFVLDRLFQHPNVPPFFATRIIRSLVTSNPSPEYIERVADVFVNNGQGVRGDLAAVIKAVLTDAEARQDTPTSTQGRLKDPMLHVLGLVRALGGQVIDASQVLYLFLGLGEEPLAPLSVFSFYSPLAAFPKHPELYGPEFQIFTPAMAIQRANFIYTLLTGQLSTAFTLDITPFVTAAPNATNLVNLVDARLFHGAMSLPLRQAILNDCYVVTDPKQRAIGALYIAAISSEYAVIR
ncbi:MAG TPA: DUF1800 domain-containing protein [Candidatus Limnocylindrales bacterium]|nr:DUF1800 domain-containing protein [Candidatus Limnocylindrales bacterium]